MRIDWCYTLLKYSDDVLCEKFTEERQKRTDRINEKRTVNREKKGIGG